MHSFTPLPVLFTTFAAYDNRVIGRVQYDVLFINKSNYTVFSSVERQTVLSLKWHNPQADWRVVQVQ